MCRHAERRFIQQSLGMPCVSFQPIAHGLRISTKTGVNVAIDAWTGPAGVVDGPAFRSVITIT